jgi:hypothetical protein
MNDNRTPSRHRNQTTPRFITLRNSQAAFHSQASSADKHASSGFDQLSGKQIRFHGEIVAALQVSRCHRFLCLVHELFYLIHHLLLAGVEGTVGNHLQVLLGRGGELIGGRALLRCLFRSRVPFEFYDRFVGSAVLHHLLWRRTGFRRRWGIRCGSLGCGSLRGRALVCRSPGRAGIA